MTSGRKPIPPAQTIVVHEEPFKVAAEAQNVTTAADRMIMDFSEVLQEVGLINGLYFSATVAGKALVEVYLKIKESKRYKGLPYRKEDGKAATVATLEEFCQVFMPKSYRRCEELARNYHLLGAELYEQAEAIGFKQRDYNALKALPSDEQAIIKQAIEANDSDKAIDLMEQMAVKHVREKELLQDQLKSKDEEINAKVRREKDLNDQNHALLKKVIRIEEATPDEDYALLCAELAKVVNSVQSGFMGLRGAFNLVIEKADANGIAYYDTLVGHVTQLHRELNALRGAYGLPIEPDKTDSERAFDYAEAALKGNGAIIN